MRRDEDRERNADLLARIDGELRTALDLEPPLGLEAAVRRRIVERRKKRRSWFAGWGLPVGATLVAATLALAVISGRLTSRVAAPAPGPRPSVAEAPAPPPPPPDSPSARRQTARPASRVARVTEGVAEVLVPGDQQILLQRLVRQLEREPLMVTAARPATSGIREIEIDALAWEPVRIEPLRVEP